MDSEEEIETAKMLSGDSRIQDLCFIYTVHLPGLAYSKTAQFSRSFVSETGSLTEWVLATSA
jgi:hypothetical protein